MKNAEHIKMLHSTAIPIVATRNKQHNEGKQAFGCCSATSPFRASFASLKCQASCIHVARLMVLTSSIMRFILRGSFSCVRPAQALIIHLLASSSCLLFFHFLCLKIYGFRKCLPNRFLFLSKSCLGAEQTHSQPPPPLPSLISQPTRWDEIFTSLRIKK